MDKRIIENKKISVIGGGSMGTALIEGLLSYDFIHPYNLSISNPHIQKIDYLKDRGVNVSSSNIDISGNADVLIFAVKPWILPDVISEIKNHIDYKKTEICSLAAGVSLKDIENFFIPATPPKICIAIPNTAMRVKESMTFLVQEQEESLLCEHIFNLLGKTMLISEHLLKAATALASCGIAYAMRYVRASVEGGVELGFSAVKAQEIITQTIKGAVTLLEEPGAHPETEIDKVTTPGGITIRGLNAMEEAGFTASVINGLKKSGT